MAAMSSKVLAEIEARAAMGRWVMTDIEVSLDDHGKCHNWVPYINGGPKCSLVRHIPNQKIKICSNCPLWKTTDATYEDIYQARVLQTYDWWRNEYVRTGQTYARDRMVDFIRTMHDPQPESQPSIVKHPRVITPIHLDVFACGFVLGVLLVSFAQLLIYWWPF
jgi:hypothetical protein